MNTLRDGSRIMLVILLFGCAVPTSAQLLPRTVRPFPTAGPRATALSAQADSLRRHASRAEGRSDLLNKQALELERNPAPAQVASALREEASRLQNEAARARVNASEHTGQIIAVTTSLATARTRVPQLQQELHILQTRLQALPPAQNEGSDPHALERATLPRDIQAKQSEIDRTIAEIRELENKISGLEGEKARFTERAAQLETEAATKNGAAASLAGGETDSAVVALRREAANLQQQAANTREEAKTLDEQAESLNRLLQRPFAPTRSKKDAQAFYDEYSTFNFGRNANISLGSNPGVGTATVEMASAYGGPVRFAATGIVARVDDDTLTTAEAREEAARQRFYAGGGSLVLSASMPILFIRRGAFTGVLQGLGKYSLDVGPTGLIDREASTIPMMADIGGDGYINVGNDDIRGFVLVHGGVIPWGTSHFFNAIGYGGDNFSYLEGALGLEFSNGLRLLGTWVDGPADLKRTFRITLQMAPPGHPK